MRRVTLSQAMNLAPACVGEARAAMDSRFGAGLFDKATEHHEARGLVANLQAGTTRDRDGNRSSFTAYTWADHYTANPDQVWFDFFRGHVCNSVSRMARGLQP